MKGDKKLITFDKVVRLLPKGTLLVDGLLFAEIPNQGFKCDRINENLIIIAIVETGILRFKINGSAYDVSPNEIFALHPGDIIEGFENISDGEGYLFICSINRTVELVREVDLYRLSMSVKNNPVIRLSPLYFNNILNCARMIGAKVASRQSNQYSSLTCLHLTEAITCEIYEGLSENGFSDDNKLSRAEIIFRDFLTMLSGMSVHRREVEWYADKLCISPKYLSDVCRKSSGRPASEWIKDYVMFDIRSQLKNSTQSIKEISNRLGFSSLTFFGKCIRRWFGQSPTELREQLRKS